jgi:hypothetical protein
MKKIRFEHEALDEPIMVNGEYKVCPVCQGTGQHERRDIDCSRLIDNMREDGDDEGIEAYFSGAYDVNCTNCGGLRVVFEPVLPEWAAKKLEDWYRCEREYERECAAERRMGA